MDENIQNALAIPVDRHAQGGPSVEEVMMSTLGTNPEAHAQAVNLARRLDVAPGLVATNPEWAKEQLTTSIDYEALRTNYPATAAYMQDKDRASVSRDDLVRNMAIEDSIRDGDLMEPGLFNGKVRDKLIAEMRTKGHKVELSADPMGFFQRTAEGVKNAEFVPFVGAGVEGYEVYHLSQIAGRAKDGKLTDQDKLDLLKYDNEMRRGTTFGGKVAAVLTNLPAFAGEIALTGGLFTAGKTAARNVGLLAAKKLLNKSVREVAESAVLRSGVNLAGWAAGATLQGTVGMPHRVAVDTMQRMLPQMQFSVNERNELETVVKDSNDGFASALGKAIVNQAIEVGTENAGAFIGKITGLEALKSAVMTKWFKLNPTKGWSQFNALLRKSKWDGVLEEFGEERLGELLRAATGLEDLKFNPEQYAVELVSFAALPLAGAAITGPKLVRQANSAAQRAQAQVEYLRSLGQEVEPSKTRMRVEGYLGYLGNLAAQDGPVKSVFVDAPAWNAHFESKGIDPREAAIDVLGSAAAYDAAQENKHAFEIPLGNYVEKLAPTEHNDPMSRVIRFNSPTAQNVEELEQEAKSLAEQVAGMVSLNQDFTKLNEERATLTQEQQGLEQQVAQAQAQAQQATSRMQEIMQAMGTTDPAQILQAAQTPEMQSLVAEFQSLQAQGTQLQTMQSRLAEIETRQQEITQQLDLGQQAQEEAARKFPTQNPEITQHADKVFNELVATGNTSEKVARVQANMFARMSFIMATRAGMTLEEFNNRFTINIEGGKSNASTTNTTYYKPGDGRGGRAPGEYSPLEGAPNVRDASGPDPRLNAVAEQYARDNGIQFRRQSVYVQVDEARAKRIAEAYDAMTHAPQDPAVQEAYANMMAQVRAQYDALVAAGYQFYLIDPKADPYEGNPWNAMRDLRANQRMGVFPTEAGFGSDATLDVNDNPLLVDTGLRWGFGTPDGEQRPVYANDLFRAVHDAFGHGLEGAGFRADGEENAWQAHARLFTGSAIGALTSETRGQNSWLNYGPYGEQNRNAKVEDTRFADQKTGLMPEWTWAEGMAPDEQDSILYQDETLAEIDREARAEAKNDKAPQAEFFQNAIPEEVEQAARFESVFKLASSKTWERGRDLKVAMQDAVRSSAEQAGVDVSKQGPQTAEYLVRVGLSDALAALKQNPNAIGWYDKKTRQALAAMALVHPEIGTDENARFAFVWALAVTSNGMKVDKNFELAERAYAEYKKTGVMPTNVGAGNAQKAINDTLALFNNLKELWGIDNLRLFMQANFTVGEISALDPELKPSGEWAETKVRGAAILGPKIGNGFFSNLYGYFDALTMDRWLIRTWGRWTGTLIILDPAKTENGKVRLQAALNALSDEDVARVLRVINRDAMPSELEEIARLIAKASGKKDLRAIINESPEGEEFRKAANGLFKQLDGQKEAPQGPAERNFIRDVFGQVLAELQTREEYKDLTMADLQAVLWYGEKRLYEFAKEDAVDGEDAEGYEDDEAPDYANAAAGVAREKGVSDKKIKAAFKRIEEDGRTTGARRSDGEPQAGSESGQQAQAGGFAESERRQFKQTVAIKRIRLGRGSDEAESFSYTRRGLGDGKRSKALKKFGVEYVAEIRAGSALRRILRNAGETTVDEKGKNVYSVDAPHFVELVSDANSASKFANLISASKASKKFGAAVYVYPEADYQGMRMFLAEDGSSGFALKPDGDIVSVFSDGGSGRATLEAAIAMGGRKLYAFDTILPHYYAAHGFVAASRLKWDDSQMPADWNKETFKKFNNGEPDVVFMALDPQSMRMYDKSDGRAVKDYNSALKQQKKVLKEIADRVTLPQADQQVTLNQSVFPQTPNTTLLQRAFHGSPHKFEKFMLDHIGTGEGNQAFGWGLYFAGNREIAEWYRKTLSGKETGQLYEVEIPENDVLLDWDKPVPADLKNKVLDDLLSFIAKNDLNSESAKRKRSGVTLNNDKADRLLYVLDGASPLTTGRQFYHWISTYTSEGFWEGDRSASLYLNSLGIKGIRYLDGTSRFKGQGNHNFVIFDDTAISMLDTFYQNENNARGSISFNPAQRGAPRREFTIRMLKKANASTFMHEAAHFYLEVFNDLASAPDAPQALREDWDRISKWLGLQAGVPVTTDQHETFARGFERYLMEGKAPAEEVRGFFASMRTWLVRIYRDLLNLNVELSDDIRGVFDRMVATDAEIAAEESRQKVEALFTEKPEGMDDLAWERYRKQVEKASRTARERMQAELEQEMLDARTAEREAEEADIRLAVTGELHTSRDYIGLHVLRFSKLPDGSDVPAPLMPMKLDKDSLVAAGFDKETMDKLRRLGVYRVEGGVSQDTAAQLLGFDSGDELVRTIASLTPIDEAIDAETKRRMDEKFPSMLEDQGRVRQAAADAVRNDKRDKVIAMEMEALARLIAKDKQAFGRLADAAPAPLGAIARQVMRGTQLTADAAASLQETGSKTQQVMRDLALAAVHGQLSVLKLRDIRPALYLAAAKAASTRAARASASGKYEEALAEKEAELVNHLLYRESRAMLKEAAKQRTYLDGMTKDSTRARMGLANPMYRDQIDQILERFNFKPVPLTLVDRRQRLADWITAQEAAGATVNIDPVVRDEAFLRDFRDMTGEELFAVYEAVKQIDHLAKLTNKLLTVQDKRKFATLVDELVAQITANTKANPRKMGSKTPGEQTKEGWDSFFAAHRKLASLVREMDGFVDGGPLYWAIMDPVNQAGNAEALETEKATVALKGLFDVFSKDELKGMTRKQVVRGATKNFNLSREDRLSIALNWGNEDNRKKLVDGYNGLTEQDVIAILDTLEKKDWDFVQSVWDYMDSFWPRIRDKQERIYGLAPEKVEATPVITKHGVYAGGYYPLKYAGARAEGESDADAAKQMMRGAVTSATTKRGHTQTRVEGVERPIRLELGVVTEHITQVIHDLTHHEMLIDVNRILRDRSIMGAIEDHYGEAAYRQLRKGLEAVAVGNTNSEDRFTRALGYIRQGVSVAGLGFNVMTSMLQAFGLSNAIPRVGALNMAKAVGRWIGSAKDMEDSIAWIYERSDMMRLRGKTMNRELNEIRNTIDPKMKTALMDSYFYLIQKGQMLADVPTWLGAYHKAREAGSTEAQAVALADQTVLDTQGGGMVKDLATVQRGGPLLKMWTTFYSYFNALWNMNVEAVKSTDFRSPTDIGRMMVDLLVLNSLPVAIQYALLTALRGGSGDDEEWYKELAKQQASYFLAQMVFVRELGGIFEGRNYEGPAGGRFFSEAYKLARQVEQGELDRGLWTSANKVGGILFHYPSTQLQRTVEGAKSLWEGKASNPAVLIVGPSKDQR